MIPSIVLIGLTSIQLSPLHLSSIPISTQLSTLSSPASSFASRSQWELSQWSQPSSQLFYHTAQSTARLLLIRITTQVTLGTLIEASGNFFPAPPLHGHATGQARARLQGHCTIWGYQNHKRVNLTTTSELRNRPGLDPCKLGELPADSSQLRWGQVRRGELTSWE